MYTIYTDGTDTEIFERPDGTREKNEFVFTGFGNGIHPYHRKQLNWAIEMLRSAGVALHIVEYPTVHEMGKDADKGYFNAEDLNIPDMKLDSGCKRNIILVQDVEMGRGWAVLLGTKDTCQLEIFFQDHRDTIREMVLLDEEWLNDQGVKFQRKTVKSLHKI